jgi:type VI secretion system protein ImpL
VSKVLAVLKHKIFIQGMGLLILSLLIWFFGPEIAISQVFLLESVPSRLLVIVLIAGLWLARLAWVKIASKKNNDAMVEELGKPDTSDIDEETGVINQHFDDALKILNDSTKGKKGSTHLYELPWYIIIGPPGSGKTTALVNSGLHFPLENQFGNEALRGVGGTRHCDWWFTKEAVLIDTAGRFTTQDSHESVDKAAWQKFMDLLKQYRKQRPINGAIIAVSLTDIVGLSDHERANYAHTIRSRIDELTKQLGIRFPVYFMFTKCDLVAGFNEFFAHFNADECAQVWGETFGLDTSQSSGVDIETYPQHFEQLIIRLKGQLLSRVNQETDVSLRPAVLGFPAQMATLKDPLTHFLRDVFSGNRFQESALLRGVYFTSGTQEGRPMDRLLGNMAVNLGVKSATAVGYHSKGKSYFLKNLLQQVIFAESELAGVDQKVVKRRRLLQRVGFIGAAASLITAVSLWFVSYNQNLDHIVNTGDLVAKSTEVAYLDDMIGANFKEILPELTAMRQASQTFDDSTMLAHSGLYQGDDLGGRTDKAYLALLESKLLPVIGARLQEMIITLSNQGETALTYEVLKAYLMYARLNEDAGVEFDHQLLSAISSADWQQTFATEPSVAAELNLHHSYLLQHSTVAIKRDAKDDSIIKMARNLLKKMPLSQQVYQSIKQEMLQNHSKDLSFSDMAGNLGVNAFTSRSQKPLIEVKMPGMFTKMGFYKDFMIQYQKQSNDYLTNNWVLGQHNAQKTAVKPEDLKRDVFNHYYTDYTKQWGGFLTDLKLKQSTNINEGMAIIESATAINGPIETLVNTVANQTDLSQPLPTGKAAQGIADTAGVVSGTTQRAVSKVNRLVRSTNKTGLLGVLGKPVSNDFVAYHRLAKVRQGEPPLARLVEESSRFALYLKQTLQEGFSDNSALEAVKKRIEGSGNNRFARLSAQMTGKPNEVNGWITSMSQAGWSMMLAKSRQELNRLWQQEVLAYYEQAIAGRYPIKLDSKVELELRDFAEFFRPKGRVDQFISPI